MPERSKTSIVSKFPLRLMPSVRRVAEDVSAREGVSLNQFINLAVAEKLAHMQHDEWLARRPMATGGLIASALNNLGARAGARVDADDKIPQGYSRVAKRVTVRKRQTEGRG